MTGGSGGGHERPRSGLARMGPNQRSAAANAASSSTSPAMVNTALLGAYQARKKLDTSSRLAASRSAIDPMGVWWYGWSAGNTAAISFS
jgi:hypothetical protein